MKETKKRSFFTFGRKVRRDHKSSVFAMVFAQQKEALALYNAISGKNYENPDDLQITTLENALYLDMKNDVSFLVDTSLWMVEHQSTVNPNMPLRDLFYVARQYEKLYGDEDIYLSRPKKIVPPFFVTLYNGTISQPERKVMRLSDLYVNMPGNEEPNLELKVIQLNINPGYNEKLKEKCKKLGEYTEYVQKVRLYERKYPLTEAAEMAIDECIQEGILSEFFRKQRREALRMILFEYDRKKYEKLLREYIREEEREEGREEGRSMVFLNMIAEGIPKEKAQRMAELDDETVERLLRKCSG